MGDAIWTHVLAGYLAAVAVSAAMQAIAERRDGDKATVFGWLVLTLIGLLFFIPLGAIIFVVGPIYAARRRASRERPE